MFLPPCMNKLKNFMYKLNNIYHSKYLSFCQEQKAIKNLTYFEVYAILNSIILQHYSLKHTKKGVFL